MTALGAQQNPSLNGENAWALSTEGQGTTTSAASPYYYASYNNDGYAAADDGGGVSKPPQQQQQQLRRQQVAAVGAKKLISVARTVTGGSFIPLFTDKVRNNVRSRAVLVGIYAVSAAFVCLLLIFAVSLTSNPYIVGTFSTSPPRTAYLGEPLSTFVFQVLDQDHKGVSGQLVYSFLTPIAPLDLTVTFDQGSTVSRTLQCIQSLVMNNSTSFSDDWYLCDPCESGIVLNALQMTDSRGMATFANFTIGHGFVGEYLLTVGLTSSALVFQTHALNIASNVQSITLEKGFRPLEPYTLRPVLDTSSEEAFRNSLEHDGEDIVATIAFIPSIRFQATYNLQDVSAIAEEAAAYFGVPVQEYIELVQGEFAPLVPYICGTIVSLDLQKSAYGTVNNVIEPLVGPQRKGIRMLNQTVCNSTVTRGPRTLSSAGYSQIFHVTLRWRQFGLLGANTRQMFFGISAMGMTIPLPVVNFTTPLQTPSQLLLAAMLLTNVTSVSVSCPLCAAPSSPSTVANHNNTSSSIDDDNKYYLVEIQEGHVIPPMYVTVKDANGNPMPYKTVYLYLEQNPLLNPLRSGSQALLLPIASPKQLVNEVAVTNGQGVAVFAATFFSVSGSPGFYDLHVVVDGVEGTWSASTTTTTANVATFVVTTSVSSCVVLFNGANDNATEYVGETWSVLPLVQVSSADGVPAPGKIVDIVAAAESTFPTVAKSFAVNEDGLAYILSVKVLVTNATLEDLATLTPQQVLFYVVIDGQRFANFTRWIGPPRNFSWTVPPVVGGNNNIPYGACAWVHILSPSVVGYQGIMQELVLKAVDALGNPVSNATIVIQVPPQYIPPLPGQSVYTVYSPPTSSNGTLSFVPNIVGVSSVFAMVGDIYCSNIPDNSDSKNRVSVVYLSRVLNMQILRAGFGFVCVNMTLRDPSLVNATHPIATFVVSQWYPSYVVAFMTGDQLPATSVTYVSSTEEAAEHCIFLSNQSAFVSPYGLYAFFVAADFNLQVPVIVSGMNTYSAEIELVQSILTYPYENVAVGQIMYPIVRIRNTQTNAPIANITVFVQYCAINPLTGQRIYQDVFSNIQDITLGGLFSASNATEFKPMTVTDDNGTAAFDALTLAGAPPAGYFSVRYCLYLHAYNTSAVGFTGNLDDDPIETNCLDDPNIGTVSFSQRVNFIASPLTMTGAPSQPLGPITVNAIKNDGSFPDAIMCAPRLIGAPSSYFVFPTNTAMSKTALYGAFLALGPKLIIQNQISLSSLLPVGNYDFVLYCSGGVTVPIALIVTATPTRLTFSIPPPLPSSPVAVKTIIPVQLSLQSASATPVANVAIQLEVQNGLSDENCTGYLCGYLDPSSVLFATTDVSGSALFALIVSEASSSNFLLTFSIAPPLSSIGTKQAAKTQLGTLSQIYGMPVATLVPYLINTVPFAGGLVRVVNGIIGGSSNSNSNGGSAAASRSGTFVYGGAPISSDDSPATTTPAPATPTTAPSSSSSSGGQGGEAGYLESLASAFVSPLLQFIDSLTGSKGQTAAVQVTAVIAVINPVVNGSWLRAPSVPALLLPENVASLVATVSYQNVIKFTLEGASAPVVQFFDAAGVPAVGRNVLVEMLPLSAGATASLDSALLTDDNGTVVLDPLHIASTTAGSFTLRVTAEGAAPVEYGPVVVTQYQPYTRTDFMEALAVFLVVFFSPMLFASVPHSRVGYLPFACLVVGGAIAVSFVLLNFLPSEPLYFGYFVFLAAITVLTEVWILGVALLDRLGYECNVYWARCVNDENKALRVFEYTMWILHVRIAHQSNLWDAKQQAVRNSRSSRLMDSKYRCIIRFMARMNRLFGDEVLDDTKFQVKRKLRMRRAIQKSLMYDPSEAFDPVYVPMNFLIVVGISITMLVTLCFLIVYVFQYILDKINVFINYLPDTNGTSGYELQIINKMVVEVLTVTIEVIVRAFPAYAQLSAVGTAIQGVDIVQALGLIRYYAAAAVERLEIAFWIGGSVATIAFVVTIAMTWLSIPATIRKIRRGALDIPSTISSTETYIGMHCLQLLIMHQLVFWLVTLVCFLLSATPIRVFLWDKLQVLIVASIVSYVTQTLLQQIIVKKFLTTGVFTVIRPELYSIYHFVGLILGVFTGLMKSVVRWGMSLGLVSALFARLDQAIFPELFASMDRGHMGFMSIVAVEAKNGNPLYLMFSAWMTLEMHLLSLGDRGAQCTAATGVADSVSGNNKDSRQQPLIPVVGVSIGTSSSSSSTLLRVDDSLFRRDFNISSGIKNLARILLRSYVGAPRSLRKPVGEKDPVTKQEMEVHFDLAAARFTNRSERVRTERIRQRFWLWWILWRNPALREFRKHRLYLLFDDVEEHDDGAAKKSAGGATVGGGTASAIPMTPQLPPPLTPGGSGANAGGEETVLRVVHAASDAAVAEPLLRQR